MTFGKVISCRKDVFVDGVVGVDIRGLPTVAYPLVARFGECEERVFVGRPVVAAQLPIFKCRCIRVKIGANEFQDVR